MILKTILEISILFSRWDNKFWILGRAWKTNKMLSHKSHWTVERCKKFVLQPNEGHSFSPDEQGCRIYTEMICSKDHVLFAGWMRRIGVYAHTLLAHPLLLPFSKLCNHRRQNSQRVVCNGLPSIKQNLCILSALICRIVFWINCFQSMIINKSFKCNWIEREHIKV